MAEIIILPVKDLQPDEHKQFFENLANKSDELIYLAKDKDGVFSMGHTPMDIRDLMFMEYSLHKIIQSTVAMYIGGDE